MSNLHILTVMLALLGQAPVNDSAEWKPARGPLARRWAAQVDPRQVHAEYPRPQMVRPEWINSDTAWNKGKSGFGTRATPGSIVSTEWNSPDIWLRREFSIDSSKAADLHLLIHHDEDAEVYLNGRQVQQLRGYTTSYALVPLDRTAAAALRPGRNVLAVHCHQTGGGQFIDVGLIDLQDNGAGEPR